MQQLIVQKQNTVSKVKSFFPWALILQLIKYAATVISSIIHDHSKKLLDEKSTVSSHLFRYAPVLQAYNSSS